MAEDVNGDAIVAYLNLSDTRLASVTAVEINVSMVKIKLTSRDRASSIYGINPILFNALFDVANEYRQASGVVALPDWVLYIDGVTLESCRLIITSLAPGKRRVMFRIKRADGALENIFTEPLLRRVDQKSLDSKFDVRLFEEILLPLENLFLEVDSMARVLPKEVSWKIRNFFLSLQLRLAPFRMRYSELAETIKHNNRLAPVDKQESQTV